MNLKPDTPLLELPDFGIANLSSAMSKKLATAVAGYANKNDLKLVNVEDLLNYFPMRYEDRSNLIQIDQLSPGLEASVEIHTRVSGGFRVGKNRARGAPALYIFEITGSDAERTRKPVVIWWFLSGKQAQHIVKYWQKKFDRGTRFVAYGKWEWDSRRNTFALKITKPDDELEILPDIEDSKEFGLLKSILDEKPIESESLENSPDRLNTASKHSTDDDENEDSHSPEFSMIHTARRVPVYRKLGQFQTKRLREIIFNILQKLDRSSVEETLPEDLCKRQNLVSRAQALEEIHFPPENASLVDYAKFRSAAQKRSDF